MLESQRLQTYEITIPGEPCDLWGIEYHHERSTSENKSRLNKLKTVVANQFRKGKHRGLLEGYLEATVTACWGGGQSTDQHWKGNGPEWHTIGYPILHSLVGLAISRQAVLSRVVVQKVCGSRSCKPYTHIFIRTLGDGEWVDVI